MATLETFHAPLIGAVPELELRRVIKRTEAVMALYDLVKAGDGVADTPVVVLPICTLCVVAKRRFAVECGTPLPLVRRGPG